MARRAKRAATLMLATVAVCAALPASAALSLEDRVRGQRAVDEVYWRHRAWPRENPSAKPRFEQVVRDDVIRARVSDDLARGRALERFWDERLPPDRLRAELERMAAGTRDAAMLEELFASLGHDPERAAECLARPALTDRLLRGAYSADSRFHSETRRRAEEALARARGADSLATLGAAYAEVTWVRVAAGSADVPEGRRGRGEVRVDSPEEWERLVARLAGWFGLHPVRGGKRGDERFRPPPALGDLFQLLPLDVVSPLQEADDRFFAAALVLREPGRITVATATWPKRGFDAWWQEVRGGFLRSDATDFAEPSGDYGRLPAITGSTCTDDRWSAVAAGQLPERRDSHTAVWTGTEMIVWGGAGFAGALQSGGRYNPATDTWTPTSLNTSTPTPRWNHTAVWTGSEMIVWGGYSGDDDTNTGGRYDPASGLWRPTSTGLGVPAIRESHTAVWTGTEMIVWGGDSVLVGFLNTGGRYAPSSDSWQPTATGASAPDVRYLHTAVWTGSEMIVWGGTNDSGFLNTGGRYRPATNAWVTTSTGSGTPTARGYHTAVWTGTEMIVWGGSASSGYVNSGARYTPSPESWNAISEGTGVPSARYLHTAVWTGSEMIVWGGFSGTRYVNSGARYNPSGNSWTPTSAGTGAPAPRGYHTAVWSGTEMIVWGGYRFDGADHELDSGGRYVPGSDRWSPTAGWSDRRKLHSAVWTGSEMIVWGGERAHPPAPPETLATGGRYAPATDTWASTPTWGNVPSAREYHTAVWTGTEMIVWGGYDPPSTEYATGGRFNPSANAWTPTSTGTGTPAARDTHTAVWTGAAMIVWGGWDGFDAFGSGSRYNPSSDTWSPTAGGPQGRLAHTALWTGSEMIVWGGESVVSGISAGRLDSGSRYNPGANAWNTVPVGAGTPSPRRDHTAVWAGNEMIVWGGRDGTSLLKTGGRYAPGSGTWTPTSSGTDAPAARAGHTAVWTGSEMVVWGGYGDDGTGPRFLDTGGRLGPSAGVWTSTSIAGAPAARDGHTAVWTGSEMAVWGGRDGASSFATGGRYCAAACASPPPSGTPQLSVTDDNVVTTISWTALAGATSYDVVRGGLGALRSSNGNFTTAVDACLADDTAATSATDAAVPPLGNGSWYLARGVSCGGNGTYDTTAPKQSGSRDPEIAASPNACP